MRVVKAFQKASSACLYSVAGSRSRVWWSRGVFLSLLGEVPIDADAILVASGWPNY